MDDPPQWPKLIETARHAIRSRIENGYPFEPHETAQSVALEMIEQCNAFPGERLSVVTRAVYTALKFEGYILPRK